MQFKTVIQSLLPGLCFLRPTFDEATRLTLLKSSNAFKDYCSRSPLSPVMHYIQFLVQCRLPSTPTQHLGRAWAGKQQQRINSSSEDCLKTFGRHCREGTERVQWSEILKYSLPPSFPASPFQTCRSALWQSRTTAVGKSGKDQVVQGGTASAPVDKERDIPTVIYTWFTKKQCGLNTLLKILGQKKGVRNNWGAFINKVHFKLEKIH